jgi:hypothetical protein
MNSALTNPSVLPLATQFVNSLSKKNRLLNQAGKRG